MRQKAEFYRNAYSRLLETLATCGAALSALRAEELENVQIEEYLAAMPVEAWKIEKHINEAADRICRFLCYEAATRFAPAGMPRLDINSQAYFARHFRTEKPEEFDPVALWDELERKYGGEKGESAGFQMAADLIVERFNLLKKPPQPRAKYVPMNVSVWIDDFDKKHLGVTRLAYTSEEYLYPLCSALSTFLRWADSGISASLLDQYIHGLQIVRRRATIKPRERIELGPDLEVVTFTTRFEFRFSLSVVEKLKVFLSTYATAFRDDNEQEAA